MSDSQGKAGALTAVASLSERLGDILADVSRHNDWASDGDDDDAPRAAQDNAAKEARDAAPAAEDAKDGVKDTPGGDAAARDGPSASPASSALRESKYDVQVTLADQQADPSSPLYSAKSFEELGLHADLLKGLYAMKFTKPSKIQERALPLLLQNPPRNMIGQSQSGTGKTAAFVLTMLSRIDFSVQKTQALALAPSRELARQIMDVVQAMGQFTPVTTAYAIPDALKRGDKVSAHLVVGTPGKTFDLIKTRALDPSAVKVFVLDEADNMLDQQGLGEQSIRVKNTMPKTCQLVLFSATFPDHVRTFAAKFAPNANEIRLKQEELSVESIRQFYMDCKTEEHKYDVLVELYNLLTIGQSIIFCAVRRGAHPETRDGGPHREAHDRRGAPRRLAPRQARHRGPRPHHRRLPLRQVQGAHRDERHRARHRYPAGHARDQLRHAAHAARRARRRDVPAPHRPHRPLRAPGRVHQLCARRHVAPPHGGDRERASLQGRAGADRRPGGHGGHDQGRYVRASSHPALKASRA